MWYQILVFVLFCLAIIDLTVGVSNDAANFLNSAIGSKVASFKTILIIASIGVLAGAVSSEGMMEVARKGIFVPSFFTFDNIMLVFVAVMLTDTKKPPNPGGFFFYNLRESKLVRSICRSKE